MWVMTPRGYFSVVEKPLDKAQGWVTIRSRDKKDLESLQELIPDAIPFQEKFWTDYPWRVRVKKEQWADAVSQMAMEIDYSNFKDRVAEIDKKRSTVYGRVWGVLLDMEIGHKWFDDYTYPTGTSSYGGIGTGSQPSLPATTDPVQRGKRGNTRRRRS